MIDNWLRHPGRVLSLGRRGLGVPDNLHRPVDGESGSINNHLYGGIDAQAWGRSLTEFSAHVVQD